MIFALGIENAYATLPDCVGVDKPGLKNFEMYVGDSSGKLNKVDANDGHSCAVGTMLSGSTTILCTDVALLPTTSPETLYCNTFTDLYTINRSTAAATFVGNLKNGIIFETNVNAMEIDSAGVAYVADVDGNLYNLNLSNGALTLRFNMGFSSAGDLAWDASTGKMYVTSQTCSGAECSGTDDGLFLIDLSANTASAVKSTNFNNVFAADFLPGELTMHFVTSAGELFELSKLGATIDSGLTSPLVFAFGGTANQLLVGGIKLAIDTSALLIAGIQTSAGWLTPGILGGVALVILKLGKKI